MRYDRTVDESLTATLRELHRRKLNTEQLRAAFTFLRAEAGDIKPDATPHAAQSAGELVGTH